MFLSSVLGLEACPLRKSQQAYNYINYVISSTYTTLDRKRLWIYA